jgi:hypothetical protein
MFQVRPPANRRIRPFRSNLFVSSALALAAALISISAVAEASAQGFRLSGASSSPSSGKQWNRSKGPSQRRPGSAVGSSIPGGGVGKPGARGKRVGGRVIVKHYRIRRPGITVGTVVLGTRPPSNDGPAPRVRPPRRPGPGTSVPAVTDRSYVPDEVVIELAANTTDQAAEALAQRFGLTRVESFDYQLAGTKLHRWRISGRRSVQAVVRAIQADGSAISVSPNFVMHLNGEPSAAAAGSPLEQYSLAKLQLQKAHTLARGGNVLVAIVDGGVDVSHPELAGVVVDMFDAIGKDDKGSADNKDNASSKSYAHGTAVAGAIAAQARLKGTAPGARILAARAFDRGHNRTEGTGYDVVKSIDWAVLRGARIINMSFAGPRDPKIERSVELARLKGVIMVAAAGNNGPRSAPQFPAADPKVIAVTATDDEDKLFSMANRGRYISVAAPGVELWLPGLQGTYQEVSGTSFASAEVAGAVALLVELNPDLSHDDVRRILMSTARDLGPRGIDPEFGAGLVDAYRALLSVAPAKVGSSTVGRTARPN